MVDKTSSIARILHRHGVAPEQLQPFVRDKIQQDALRTEAGLRLTPAEMLERTAEANRRAQAILQTDLEPLQVLTIQVAVLRRHGLSGSEILQLAGVAHGPVRT